MCVWADSGRIRQKRAWIIDSFTIEEEYPGPFPYKIGKVSGIITFSYRAHSVQFYLNSIFHITVHVKLLDNNDHVNISMCMLFVFQVELDRSYLVNYILHGDGVDKDPKNILSIDKLGNVLVHGKVDYESGPKILRVSSP